MKKEDFTHNNMVPFFGGKITQNTEHFSQRKLGLFTGASDPLIKPEGGKKELKPFFAPTRDLSHVNGRPVDENRQMGRYIPGDKKTSELPFQQIRVGPGLNQGYTNKPSGGFHQENTRDYIMPKTIDELRTKMLNFLNP